MKSKFSGVFVVFQAWLKFSNISKKPIGLFSSWRRLPIHVLSSISSWKVLHWLTRNYYDISFEKSCELISPCKCTEFGIEIVNRRIFSTVKMIDPFDLLISDQLHRFNRKISSNFKFDFTLNMQNILCFLLPGYFGNHGSWMDSSTTL